MNLFQHISRIQSETESLTNDEVSFCLEYLNKT